MKKGLSSMALILVVALTSCSSNSEDSLPEPVATLVQQSEESQSQTEPVSTNSNTSPPKKPKTETKSEVTTKVDTKSEATAKTEKPGSYLTLREYEDTKEQFVDADVVLFFNANWCSTCKIARDNIESNLESIPSNLAIVVVDFDRETDLRKRYGVTIQHTFVQIDRNGNELAKWAGSTTVKEIAEKTV